MNNIYNVIILLLHLSGTGVEGLLLIMVFTDSSISQRFSRELFKLSLDAAVESLNCFSAKSKSFVVLGWKAVAEEGGFLWRGIGGGLAAMDV